MSFMETFHYALALISHQCLICTKHRLFTTEQQPGLSLLPLHFCCWLFPKVALRPHPYWRAHHFFLRTIPPVYQDCFSSVCEHLHGAAATSGRVSGWAHVSPRRSSEHAHIDLHWSQSLKTVPFYNLVGGRSESWEWGWDSWTCVISRQISEQPQDRKCRGEG